MATMPKRRKSKDNPYILDYDEKKHIYTVSFTDNKKEAHKVEITNDVFEAFNGFELEDISHLHKMDKYIDGRRIDGVDEQTDIFLYHKANVTSKSLTDEVEDKILLDEIKEAINLLDEIQKRRIKKYFFDNMTYEQIAKEEHCTKRAVKFSIDIGIEKISKKIKK